jgi:hypothetical protein
MKANLRQPAKFSITQTLALWDHSQLLDLTEKQILKGDYNTKADFLVKITVD